jgi:hypothetical protein
MPKPKAADRTVDMFTGQTNEQAKQEVIEEAPKGSETILQAAERWRANAFFTAEVFSKSWDTAKDQTKYRITVKEGHMFLEQFGIGSSDAYKWCGIMFPTKDLYEITSVFVRAAKELQANGS